MDSRHTLRHPNDTHQDDPHTAQGNEAVCMDGRHTLPGQVTKSMDGSHTMHPDALVYGKMRAYVAIDFQGRRAAN